MKLRLSGTQDECSAAVDALGVGFVVREVSGFDPHRGATVWGRVSVDAEPTGPATGRARPTATRTDQNHTDHGRRGLPGGPASSLDRTGGPW